MDNLVKQIAAEIEHVEKSLNNLETAMAIKEKSVIELAAIATFLHNIYNGIENILKRILKAKNIIIPKSDTWHKDLLKHCVSDKIIHRKLSENLFEYLTFRHFFIHSYGFMLEESPLEDLADNISRVWTEFLAAIEYYRK